MSVPVLVDSNVLIDVLQADTPSAAWSEAQLNKALRDRTAAINPLILAELAAFYASPEELARALPPHSYRWEALPFDAAFPAGHAYRDYRRRGGTKTSPLPDFLIGAHAQVAGMTLLTRDVRRYRTYFPDVPLIFPPEVPEGGAAGE